MLEWLDRYMAKFAQTDHIRREEHARRQEEASPAHEEAVALLEAFPYSGSGRARVIAAALSAISQETLLDAAYARRLLRAMVEGFSQTDADVQTTLAPAQVALNLLPTLRAAATAGGSVGAPFALIEGTLAMRTGQFDVAIKRLGDVDGNLKETIRLISDCKMPIEQALLFTTKNVGDALGFKDQGRVEVGACANACLFTEDFNLTHVVARGRVMMRDGEVVVKGTFEI